MSRSAFLPFPERPAGNALTRSVPAGGGSRGGNTTQERFHGPRLPKGHSPAGSRRRALARAPQRTATHVPAAARWHVFGRGAAPRCRGHTGAFYGPPGPPRPRPPRPNGAYQHERDTMSRRPPPSHVRQAVSYEYSAEWVTPAKAARTLGVDPRIVRELAYCKFIPHRLRRRAGRTGGMLVRIRDVVGALARGVNPLRDPPPRLLLLPRPEAWE